MLYYTLNQKGKQVCLSLAYHSNCPKLRKRISEEFNKQSSKVLKSCFVSSTSASIPGVEEFWSFMRLKIKK